jgi:hypothetical protein
MAQNRRERTGAKRRTGPEESMMLKRHKLVQAFLTGKTPTELYGEEISEPSDEEIKNFIIAMPRGHITAIHKGPFGDRFKKLCNEAMSRLADKEMIGKRPSQGRAATGIVDFSSKEVSPISAPINPEKK